MKTSDKCPHAQEKAKCSKQRTNKHEARVSKLIFFFSIAVNLVDKYSFTGTAYMHFCILPFFVMVFE